jgi:autotransporter-associated beta strand protein/T5SS/PEP-CTERM-associated repeat protein
MPSSKFEIKRCILNKYLTVSGFAIAAVASAVPSAVAGNTWVGGTSQDWNDSANWGGAFPTGNVIVNTATGNYPIISANSSFTPVDVFVGSAGTGRLDQTAGTAGTGSGNWFFVGASTGGNGTYNLADTSTSGGSLTGFGEGAGSFTAGRMYIGGGEFNGTGTGVVNINTTGTLTTTTTGARSAVVGYDGTGTLNLDNGTISTAGEFWVGAQGGSHGTLNQSGGTINSSSWFVVGFNGTATVNQSGGTINASQTDGAPTIASQAAGVGTLNVSGGTFNSSGKQMLVGEGGTGTLTVSGSGVVNVTDATNGLKVAANTGSNGTVNLDGGTIQANKVLGGAGTSTFNFNGGTLQALADNATFVSGLTNVNVKAGGAVIDSNSFNVTIGQALTDGGGGGGLTKNGLGTLTLGGTNTYTGSTTVNNGTLSLTGSILSNQIAFTITDTTSGQFAVENSGFSFSGNISFTLSGVSGNGLWTLFAGSQFGTGDLTPALVTSSFGDFTDAGGGVWTLAASGRDWTFDATQGTLTAVPEPGEVGIALAGLLGVLVLIRRRRMQEA